MTAKKKGRFSSSEEAFVRQNYLTMSDKQIADALNRDANSILQFRRRKSLDKNGTKVTDSSQLENSIKKKAYISKISDKEKRKMYLDELRATAQYRNAIKSFSDDETHFYEERYLDFMMDPTIETMTSAEKDALHRKTITEIRMHRFMEDEKNFRDSGSNQNRAREIQECQEAIYKCEKSLNATREQRLKDGQDQSINFTKLIKELQDPAKRQEVGYEACMLKYLAERKYEESLGKTIMAGDDSHMDLSKNFLNKSIPEEYEAKERDNGSEGTA